jgi:lysophospholipase L1-like esterase
MRELAQFVFDHHLKQDSASPQRGMVYEYFDIERQGAFDQFVQGEALDTMHDGAWLAAAMVNAFRATGDPFYKEMLTQWQLPFYLKMLNHSDDLFTTRHNHVRAEHRDTWKNSKEWLLQEGEKGFVPYFWDDGASVSLEMRRTKRAELSFPGFDQFAHTGTPNPQYRLHGYSLGSSNHMAQDLGVMLQQAWLLLKDSSEPADRALAAEVALGAKHLHECRMRHHGYIPMCVAPAALANADAELMKRVPAADSWKSAAPANHYTQALYSYKPNQHRPLPGFADDQQYRYYYGLARHAGELPRPLVFKLIYDAYTEPMLYRYYSDDAPAPPGINRFDLHPYYCLDGKLANYRSDRKGPDGNPKPIGSRMGPQNMICTGWALQALAAYPGIWEERHRKEFQDDLRVEIVDPPSAVDNPAKDRDPVHLGNVPIVLIGRRRGLEMGIPRFDNGLVVRLFSGPDAKGSFAELTLHHGQSPRVRNENGQTLLVETLASTEGIDVLIPYTVIKAQKPWANGIEHGRYSIQIGDTVRNFYLASDERQVKAWLKHELAGGLRTWQAIFREYGYIPTGIDAGATWQNFSDSGGYAHLISAASQWLLCLEGKRDWEVHNVAGAPPAAIDPGKEQQRIARWEPQIKAFEEQDAENPPPQGAVLFVGSSSIRLWRLSDSFPELITINRGFGGSQLADSVHYAHRLVIKHKPRVVVLYAGDNDLASGKTPQQVAGDFAALIAKVQSELPETKMVYIGIKPSLARWKLIDRVRDANLRLRGIAELHAGVTFVDVEPAMLNADGQPREDLFVKDGLHLNEAGYRVWTSLLKPVLQDARAE